MPFVGCFQTGFNTQPPEGGWEKSRRNARNSAGFNTQPPEGGWFRMVSMATVIKRFQHTAA